MSNFNRFEDGERRPAPTPRREDGSPRPAPSPIPEDDTRRPPTPPTPEDGVTPVPSPFVREDEHPSFGVAREEAKNDALKAKANAEAMEDKAAAEKKAAAKEKAKAKDVPTPPEPPDTRFSMVGIGLDQQARFAELKEQADADLARSQAEAIAADRQRVGDEKALAALKKKDPEPEADNRTFLRRVMDGDPPSPDDHMDRLRSEAKEQGTKPDTFIAERVRQLEEENAVLRSALVESAGRSAGVVRVRPEYLRRHSMADVQFSREDDGALVVRVSQGRLIPAVPVP